MKRLLPVLLIACLSLALAAPPAGAGKTERLCYDFDGRISRVKERIGWYERTLNDDLAGLRHERSQTVGIPDLMPAYQKLSLAIRLCEDALGELRVIRDRVPREIDCGGKDKEIRYQMDAQVQALTEAEGRIANLSVISNRYRSLRSEAAAFIDSMGYRLR